MGCEWEVAMRALGGIQVLIGLVIVAGCGFYKQAGNVAKLDEKNGFRDVRLLTPLSEFPDLQFVELKNGMGCFKRPKENLTVGEATVGSIRYCFYKGRLASVSLWGAGAKTAGALVKEMRRNYGNGEPFSMRQEDGTGPVGEMWKGEKVTAVLLFVEHRSFPQMDVSEVAVTVSANEILEEMDLAGQTEELVGEGKLDPPTP
jgi:hypothetical protein